MKKDQELRTQVEAMLMGAAHMGFDEAVKDFPISGINKKMPRVTYSFWHLLEHMRISLQDMVDWIEGDTYTWLKWPDEYWPKQSEKATKNEWDTTVAGFRKNLNRLITLAKEADLYAFAKHSKGKHTILRCLLLKADHNAYHIGEFAIGRQVANLWPKDRKG